MGKHITFKSESQKNFIRLRSLGSGYYEEQIRVVIGGKKPLSNRKRVTESILCQPFAEYSGKTASRKSGRLLQTFSISF